MTDKMDKAEFWLPSEFLTDEDLLMGNKENIWKNGSSDSSPVSLCFPPVYPYGYGGSPVESPVGYAQAESDEEETLLADLTQQLNLRDAQKLNSYHHNHEKSLVLSGSPQSTLTHVENWSGQSIESSNGSPNGPSQVSSPPTSPLGSNNDAWDLIYRAAGEVARLKMNIGDGLAKNNNLACAQKNLCVPPPLRSPSLSNLKNSPWQQISSTQSLRNEKCEIWSGHQLTNKWNGDHEGLQNRGARFGPAIRNGSSAFGGFIPPDTWANSHAQQRNQQHLANLRLRGTPPSGRYEYAYSRDGSGSCVSSAVVKRGCAGTGVFLPRRYGDSNNASNNSEFRRKQGNSAMYQAKGTQFLNKSSVNPSAIAQPQPQLSLNYDALEARSNVVSAQPRRNICPETPVSHEICLPQEWTY